MAKGASLSLRNTNLLWLHIFLWTILSGDKEMRTLWQSVARQIVCSVQTVFRCIASKLLWSIRVVLSIDVEFVKIVRKNILSVDIFRKQAFQFNPIYKKKSVSINQSLMFLFELNTSVQMKQKIKIQTSQALNRNRSLGIYFLCHSCLAEPVCVSLREEDSLLLLPSVWHQLISVWQELVTCCRTFRSRFIDVN